MRCLNNQINPLTAELSPPHPAATLVAVRLFKGLTVQHIYIYIFIRQLSVNYIHTRTELWVLQVCLT